MVKVDYEELMRSKSEDGLKAYIENSAKYQPDAVNAAIQELALRGQALPEGEINNIRQYIAVEIEKEKKSFKFAYDQDHLVVNEEGAPLLYSKSVIWICSVLFGTFFGSIMMAMNFRKNNYKGVIPVILFGFLYSGAVIILLSNNMEIMKGLGLPIGILGAVIFTNYFWPKYIGNETKFRKRPIWIPLGIGLFITALYLVFLFKYL